MIVDNRLPYRPEINGLPAFAVLPVVLFHAGFAPFSGGYVGVDVFFVISGYLITSILMEDLRSGRFSIARFYERRARRIFAYALLCADLDHRRRLPLDGAGPVRGIFAHPVTVVLLVSNIYIWRGEDYFA